MATPYVEGYSANAELFMTLPLLAGLYLLVLAGDSPPGAARGRWLVAGCGALAAVALLIKPSGVAALPPLVEPGSAVAGSSGAQRTLAWIESGRRLRSVTVNGIR